MSLSIGIVGLPNVGKSTLFNALTKNDALAANYPFATIEPNTGIVAVPDPRLEKLSKLYDSAPIKPATVTFVDIAGLVAGAHKGEGLGNKFLANIREVDAICHVVRAFEDDNVQHVDSDFHPKQDIETINTELILADIQTVDKRLERTQKELKGDASLKKNIAELEKAKEILDNGQTLHSAGFEFEEEKDVQLITLKPTIYVFNMDEDSLSDQSKHDELSKMVAPSKSVFVCAKVEAELIEMDENEAKELLSEIGQEQSGLVQLSQVAYEALGLQSFLTAGEKEVRAWTIKEGTKAPQAAGVIHGDFERGFISAEVVNFDELMKAGSRVKAKEAGRVRLEGKDYVMQEGDVVEFRFNV